MVPVMGRRRTCCHVVFGVLEKRVKSEMLTASVQKMVVAALRATMIGQGPAVTGPLTSSPPPFV